MGRVCHSNGRIVNAASGKCLDAANGSSANGTRLIIWTCGSNANQQWSIPAQALTAPSRRFAGGSSGQRPPRSGLPRRASTVWLGKDWTV
ncbi:RICIN domain-containing protein [Nonomuraea dietziae]|uniref:RICIN domain-containing protein n=1 Tax=Nonomuraea dietziae TaxID=65515 RepID=UPI0031D2C761